MNTFQSASGDFDDQRPGGQHGTRRSPQYDGQDQGGWPPAWEQGEDWPGDGPTDREGAAEASERYGSDQPQDREQRTAEALLRAARRPEPLDPFAAQQALGAFRSVRTAGRPRTRRRDDWRPRTRLCPPGAWRVGLATLVASLALGGVAYAAFVAFPGHGGHSHPAPHASAAPSPGTGGPAPSRGVQPPTRRSAPESSSGARPGSAPPDAARCRTYLDDLARHPHGERKTDAYRELVKDAGGKSRLRAYCDALLSGQDDGQAQEPPGAPAPGHDDRSPDAPSRPGRSGANTSGEGRPSDDDDSGSEDEARHGGHAEDSSGPGDQENGGGSGDTGNDPESGDAQSEGGDENAQGGGSGDEDGDEGPAGSPGAAGSTEP